jgi:hypothetical protein
VCGIDLGDGAENYGYSFDVLEKQNAFVTTLSEG